MKFELNERLIGRIIGISMAAAVTVTVSMAAEILNIKDNAGVITKNNSAMAENTEENSSNAGDTTVIPFADDSYNYTHKESGKLYDIYSELVRSERQKSEEQVTSVSEQTAISTSSSQTSQTISTTTTVSSESSKSQTATESETTAAPDVSNGKREFNYNDVSSIAADLKTLRDFAEELNPTSFCWDTSDYKKYGYVKISLISAYGNVTLDVKPVEQYTGSEPYLIDGQESGSVSGSSITDWEWYNQNKDSGCNICSVTWAAREFAISPVRNVKLGTKMADLIDSYLCVNGGATTLYKASDVIKSQNKLNALLAAEDAYTFVSGKIYTMESYIEKYYSGRAKSYRFAGCSYVVQYGCNSIMDYNYTTGSWIIEYAIKDDRVVGITFMNKSYYEPKSSESKGNESSDTESTTSSTTAFDQVFGE